MKRFRFRLQPLIVIRNLEENKARAAFLDARQQRVAAEENLSAARQVAQQLDAASLERQKGSLAAGEWVQLAAERSRAEQAIVTAQQAVAVAREAEESGREQWVESRRRLKVIERLRENAVAEHARESARLEQEMLDELAVLRASATAHPLT